MSHLIHRLASIKIAVALLAVVMVALAAGTILESTDSRERAMAQVYNAWWFRLLLWTFALNVVCSLADRWPWSWRVAGYVMTHVAMLVILAGSLVTDRFKTEGVLVLWEGQQSSTVERLDRHGRPAPVELPFSVRLDDFQIDYYQGTRRPAMFRSRVTVTDPRTNGSFPFAIEMNRELSHAGWKLFQSSYKQVHGREQTILSVSRDFGQPIVFLGYGLLLCGMVTTLSRRIAARRALASGGSGAARRRPKVRRAAAALLVLAALGASGIPAVAAPLPDARVVSQLRALPVQHDGRVMPLDTVAREAVWQVTGEHGWRGLDPVAVVIGWSFHPDAWAAEPLLPIDMETALALAVPERDGRASFRDLASSRRALDAFRRAHQESEAERPLTAELEAALEIEQRLLWMQRFLNRTAFRVEPNPRDPQAAWTVPQHLHAPEDLIAWLREAPQASAAGLANLDVEVRYNRVRPTRLAWWILVPATLISLAAWRSGSRWMDALAVGGLIAGFGVMSWGIAQRWTIAGRIPASNMYESMLFLGWGVALFALVALMFLRSRMVVLNATAMAALAMLLTDRLPMDPFIHPMPPVLSGTPWLAIHVPIIMVSYSVLALGVLIAHMQIGIGILAPARQDLFGRMEDLHYWYIHIGSILLIAGILTGSIWAASSWGRYWGWDPKEVWSLIAFLAYTAILHGRLDRFIGRFGVAALSIVAFWTILMTYIGVNYVLAAGLHSYGFGGSGVVRWMLILALAEAAFLGVGLAARRRATVAAAAA